MELPLFADADRTNPFLSLFYDNPTRWCFHSQMYFVCESIRQQQSILHGGKGGILDHSPYEMVEVMSAALHFEGALVEEELTLIKQAHREMTRSLAPPDLLIHLSATPSELIERIRLRNRAFEHSIDLGYLQAIEDFEDLFVQRWNQSPMFSIDSRIADVRDSGVANGIIARAIEILDR